MKTRRFSSKETLVFFAIILTTIILRCLFIDARGIWYDDAFSIQLAKQNFGAIISGTAADTMPPLYYFLLHFWMMISKEIWWCRVLSLILSIGASFFLYLIIKENAGSKPALWAILWYAFSPFQIYHAQELRMYTLLQITQAAYIYSFIKIAKSERTSWLHWIALILCGALSLYTHNLAIFFLPIPNIYLFFKKQWKIFFELILAQFVIIILFLPWVFLVPGQIQKIQTAFWTSKPGLLEIVQSAINYVGSLYSSGQMLMIVSALSLGLFLVVVSVFFCAKSITKNQRLLFGLLLFFVPTELFIVSYFMRPIFVTRGFITSLLFFDGIAGLVISSIDNKIAHFIFGFSAVVIAILSLPTQYIYNQFPRSPFHQVIMEIEAQISSDEIILHDNKLSFLPSYIYHPEVPQIFLADKAGSSNDTLAVQTQKAMGLIPDESIENATNDYSGIYFIVFTETIEDYQDLGVKKHPILRWLEDHYPVVNRYSFQDLLVYHFSR